MKEAWYLADYSLKMISCIQGEQSVNYERGRAESSTVIFRLCPLDSCGTDNTTSTPCEEGYGDFAVGIDTFADAYVETVKEYYNSGMQYYSYDYGEFNVEEYVGECSLFDEEGAENDYSSYGYTGYSYAYIGVACTEDGTDIRLASFSDPYCSTESDVSFSDSHNGMALPYGDGGLIPNQCMSCMTLNDQYEAELSEFCQQTYENANYRCEENMQSFNSYYGQDNRGCEYLEDKVPKSSSKSSWSVVKSGETQSSTNSGNFFSNQSESVKLAEEYFVLLVVMGCFGAAIATYFIKESVRRKATQKASQKEGVETTTKETSFAETLKSAAMLAKVTAAEVTAKIIGKNQSTLPKGDYSNMEEEEHEDKDKDKEESKSTYVAPITEAEA